MLVSRRSGFGNRHSRSSTRCPGRADNWDINWGCFEACCTLHTPLDERLLQADSLGSQEELHRAYAAREGHEIVRIFRDSASGRTVKRHDGFQAREASTRAIRSRCVPRRHQGGPRLTVNSTVLLPLTTLPCGRSDGEQEDALPPSRLWNPRLCSDHGACSSATLAPHGARRSVERLGPVRAEVREVITYSNQLASVLNDCERFEA